MGAVEETVERPVHIRFIEDSAYQELMKNLGITTSDYGSENLEMILTAETKISPSNIFTRESTELILISASGEEIKISCAVPSDSFPKDTLSMLSFGENPDTLTGIASLKMLERFDMIHGPVNLELTFQSINPRQSTAQMQKMLDEAGITSAYTLYNIYELFDQNRNILFIINLFTSVFIVMISLIAIANVFNTISTNIKLRRRELAMLRSIGISDRDFNKMMSFECIFYGIRTLLFGLPISGILSFLIYLVIAGGKIGGADGLHYIFPWGSIGISLCGVFLVIFITTLYAVSRIKKENIIDALRDDIA